MNREPMREPMRARPVSKGCRSLRTVRSGRRYVPAPLAQDPEGYGTSERLVSVLGAELGVDAHEVGLHGCEGDREVIGDLTVGATFGQKD